MHIDERSFLDPRQNLDYDDELLRQAEEGRDTGASEVLRFWESPVLFVVLGRTSKEEEDVDLEACARDGIPVLRRSSGGGTVIQGPGCLNFSLILSKASRPGLLAINDSYRVILDQVLKGLATLEIRGGFRPVCDLVLEGTAKKFSGNAQRRGKKFLLHHGTILYAFDLDLIGRYLKMPLKMPEYRCARSHGTFVTNVAARPDDLRRVITASFL